MKKLLIVLMAILVLLPSCGRQEESEAAESSATVSNTTNPTVVTTTTTTTTPTTTTTTTKKTTTAPKFGSRKNPIKMDEGVVFTESGYNGNSELEMRMENVIRGSEAAKMVKDWNRFNEIPIGEEVVIVTVTLHLSKWESVDDSAYIMSDWDFDYFTEDFARYDSEEYLVVENEFWVEAYEGATVSGNLAFLVPEGDNGYIVMDSDWWWSIS